MNKRKKTNIKRSIQVNYININLSCLDFYLQNLINKNKQIVKVKKEIA